MQRLFLLLLFVTAPAHAVTVAEALAAEKLIAEVDSLAPEQRSAFIGANRDRLNQALQAEQIVDTIRHTVQITALASRRLYHRPLMCGVIADEERGDDDQEVGGAPPLPPPAPLADMVKSFKAEIRAALKLPDDAATDARLDQLDVTDVIANRMLADNKCVK
ncbi:MAG TPA: hypothetical protein VKP60_09450 [Magnetospirillaceae bacterium]|nr:hypothetical protein [Magnetospirillaceae bacterium]